MNKQQFIENLKLKLKDESYEYVCQVIEYYDEMISDLIEDGKTEQEAIESLGWNQSHRQSRQKLHP